MTEDLGDQSQSLLRLGAGLDKNHEVIGIAHEAKAVGVELPVQEIKDDVCQQRGDDSSYTKDNSAQIAFRDRREPVCCVG